MKDRPRDSGENPEGGPPPDSWTRRHEHVRPRADYGDRLRDPDPERAKMLFYGKTKHLLQHTIDNVPIDQQVAYSNARKARSRTTYEGSELDGAPNGYPKWQLEDYTRNEDGTKGLSKTDDGKYKEAYFMVPGEPDEEGRPTQYDYELRRGEGAQDIQSVRCTHTALDFAVAKGEKPATEDNDGTKTLSHGLLETPDEYDKMYERLSWAVDNIS